MFMPERSRSPGQKRSLGLPGTLEMRYFLPLLGVIRGMSVQGCWWLRVRFSAAPTLATTPVITGKYALKSTAWQSLAHGSV
jgi:hypothetical protein